MLPSSQQVLIESQQGAPLGEGIQLAEAFSDFIAASSRLELSYRDLQAEVAELSLTLSERNRALSESLSENRALGQRLELILDNIPCGVLVVDDNGSVQLANPEAARLFGGVTSPGLQSRGVIAPALRLELEAPITPADGDEQELSFETVEGKVWIAVRRVPLPAYKGDATGRTESVLMIRDISARKRIEEEREAARDAVALAQVSALLAHEIRNPLASLELFAGLLNEDPEHREGWISHLRAGIRSLSGTVNNVLTLHGKTSLLLEPVDVALETKLAIDFMQPLARQVDVNLEFVSSAVSQAGQAGALVQGNRSALHQVLMNLCTNALRHTPRGGRVVVQWSPPPEGTAAPCRLTVTDTGCGIAPEHLPRLFEVGFSGSGATSGLGLAVCHRLVQQLGGSIAVKTRVGHGSTFTVELPQI